MFENYCALKPPHLTRCFYTLELFWVVLNVVFNINIIKYGDRKLKMCGVLPFCGLCIIMHVDCVIESNVLLVLSYCILLSNANFFFHYNYESGETIKAKINFWNFSFSDVSNQPWIEKWKQIPQKKLLYEN